tara:strand:+ start:638 stop:856 length:219 start_codon:yes stop_codon:yes gene_type:complete
MKIEIDIPKEILGDMIMEQEMKSSSCFIGKSEPIDLISQEFLVTLLTEYKYKSIFNKSLDYISLKISKANGN